MNGVIVDVRARLAGIRQQLRHRVDRHVHYAGDRPHGGAFAEEREDLDALGERELVHAPHGMNFFA